MMHRAAQPTTKHRWLAGLATTCLVLAASGCEEPAHAAVVKCSGSNLSDVAVSTDCTVNIAKFDKQPSASITVNTKRQARTRAGAVRSGAVSEDLGRRGNIQNKK